MSAGLLLIRHGHTAWNGQGRYQGHLDTPLDSEGLAQAEALVIAFRQLRLAAVYSSDLSRAVATAQPLARAHGLPVVTDPRLRELDFGQWDGRLAEEVIAADPPGWQAWWEDPLTLAPPGGETLVALWERVRACLDELAAHHVADQGTVAVVTHGGPLRVLLALQATGRLHPPPNHAGVPNGGWLLVRDHHG